MSLKRKVDVVIPIYNAFDDLVQCIESIQKWTNLNENRLILVNDNSSDKRVSEYLEKICKENIIVIQNKENKGFSANVNIGMAQSEKNDVILLNSDTVVTKNWLQKLEECAYSDCTIATVTPLSNNATLCSVPDFCAENEIPDGYTVDEYAELIERVSLNRYPEIPVAHGFCMYIKREVINKIGVFDAETFKRGYGEENDFCCRAIEVGYRHVMCDNTFILHTGTKSFVSEEKQRYISEHEKIIDDRYPELNRAVQIHCRDNPNAEISENIRFWINYNKLPKCKTILYLVQADFRLGANDNVGGTQLHVKDLTLGLRNEYNILVAARDRAYLNVTLYTQHKEFFFKYYIGECGNYRQFRSAKFAEVYRKILENFEVDGVHVHHTKGLSLEIFYEAKKKGIPVFATIHDYYYLCPSADMISNQRELCIGREKRETCAACIKERMGIIESVPYISVWRKEHIEALKQAEVIFVPSNSTKTIILEYFKELQEKIIVVEHGSKLPETRLIATEHTQKKQFNVAFLGGINVAKGYRNVIELIKSNSEDICWHLFGIFERMDESVERKRNFVNVGAYQRAELPQLLREYEIDLICILPICSETFCYTLSEAVMCGVPVVVTDVGALGERVRDMECGWVVPSDASVQSILEFINGLKKRGRDYQEKLKKVQQIKIKNVDEMCEDYRKVYETQLTQEKVKVNEYDYRWLLNGIMNVVGREVGQYDRSGDLAEQLADVERQLYELSNSFTYRTVQLIAKIKIPFRKQIKTILIRIYRMIRKRK